MVHTAGAARRVSQRPIATVAFRQQHGKTWSNELTGARGKSSWWPPHPFPESAWRSPSYGIMQLSKVSQMPKLKIYQVNRKGWNPWRKGWSPWGLAAILWRSGRFAILVFLRSILAGNTRVGSGALSWACATRAGACGRISAPCGGTSGTDAGTTAICTRVSISTRGGPTLSDAIRMTGRAASGRVIVSGSARREDRPIKSARSAPPTNMK